LKGVSRLGTCQKKKKKNLIGDHTVPRRGFGLSTPRGAEWGRAMPSKTGRRRQREREQRAMHQPRSEFMLPHRHRVIRHGSPNQ
jgi:hypothetical protein